MAEGSESKESKSAQTGDHTFEFTNNVAVMRFIRMFLSLQIVAVMIDNTYVELPVLFRIFSRDVLFYVIRFYSRPFIDVIYLGDYYWSQIAAGAASVTQQARSLSMVEEHSLNMTGEHSYRSLSYTSR